MDPLVARRCHSLIGASLVLLTVGVGYCVIFETCLADFLIVIAGLILGWAGLLYCVGYSYASD